MKVKQYRSGLLYLLFCAVALFLYRHCVHAHFLDDSLSSFYDYKLQGASAFWSSFNFPSLYYGHDLFYFGFYFLFGLNDWAWHILFICLYCLNTLLIFKIAETTLKKFSFNQSTSTAFITCLFFLCSPYQTENMIWVATLHYQIAMLCLFIGILFIVENRSLTGIYFFFTVSLLTLEITFVFPGIWFVCYVLFRKSSVDGIKKIVIPHTIIILLYFVMMKLLKGNFIPHYGTEHLQGWSLLIVFSTLLKYFVKLLGFVHFLEYPFREKIYGWCDNPLNVTLVWLGVFGAILFAVNTKYKREAKLIAVLLLFIFVALLPVLNMYFMFLNRVENDRLSFFATPFLYLMIAFLITRFPFYVFVPVSVFVLLIMKKLLGLYTWYWINAAEVQQRTLNSYQWFEKEKVYMLNLPQNFGGAYIYRRQWRFGSAMLVVKNKNILKNICSVAGQNLLDINDGVKVTQLDSLTFDVAKDGDGWFWNGPMGAYNYETDDYILKLNEYTYTITFKHSLKDTEAIIYQQGGIWREIKSTRQ